MKKRFNPASWALAIIAILIVCFMLLPIFVIFFTSFSDSKYIVFPPKGYTLKWYQMFLKNHEYRSALATSIRVSLLSMMLGLLLGVPAAYGLFQWKSKVSTSLKTLFMAPLSLPGIVWAIGLILFFTRLALLGTTVGLVSAHTIIMLPYVIRLTLSSLAFLDMDNVNAARTLGATPIQAFFKVTLPAIRPGIIISAIFGFMVSFNDVTISTFIAGTKNLTYPVRMFVQIRTEGIDPQAIAVSAVIMFCTIIIALVAEKLFNWSHYL